MTSLAQEYLSLRDEIDEAIHRVLESGRYALEAELEQFETEFADYIGVRYAVGVGSGSDGLTIALRACNLESGDEVITAPNTDSPTASAIVHAGAGLVFADVDPDTFNIDPDQIERRITEQTRVLLPVHLFGLPAEMDAICELAVRHNLTVVEDGALAVGARYRGRRTGSFGLIGCFSLAPSKILGAVGDAGVIVTDDEKIAERVRVLRNYGHAPGTSLDPTDLLGGDEWRVLEHGHNSRLDALQAAVLRVKLGSLEHRIARRRSAAATYDRLLADLPVTTPSNPEGVEPTYFAYNILAENRETLRRGLAAAGVATRLYYSPPLNLQPAFGYLGQGPGSFPVSEHLAERMFALPIYPQITEEQLEWVAAALEHETSDRPRR